MRHRYARRRLPTAALTGLLLLPISGSASAQEVRGYWVGLSSHNPELDGSRGGGASFGFDLLEHLQLRGELRIRDSGTTFVDRVCDTYVPRRACNDEEVSSDLRLSSGSVAALPTFSPWRGLHLSGGAGLSLSQIDYDAEGVSGRRADFHTVLTAHVGYLLAAAVSVQPVERFPLTATAGWMSHWIDFDGCTSEPVYTPLCGTHRLSELEVGVGVRF